MGWDEFKQGSHTDKKDTYFFQPTLPNNNTEKEVIERLSFQASNINDFFFLEKIKKSILVNKNNVKNHRELGNDDLQKENNAGFNAVKELIEVLVKKGVRECNIVVLLSLDLFFQIKNYLNLNISSLKPILISSVECFCERKLGKNWMPTPSFRFNHVSFFKYQAFIFDKSKTSFNISLNEYDACSTFEPSMGVNHAVSWFYKIKINPELKFFLYVIFNSNAHFNEVDGIKIDSNWKPKPYICALCRKKVSILNLYKELVSVKNKEGETEYRCKKCLKGISDKKIYPLKKLKTNDITELPAEREEKRQEIRDYIKLMDYKLNKNKLTPKEARDYQEERVWFVKQLNQMQIFDKFELIAQEEIEKKKKK